ncbi:hypothetical protein EYC80_001090 [Monilinia laxa]|uniref:Uncharacterized protein n=1 Tax=Monilinia laxa TaxID=61186 RepID=A0A5N6K823_MONLA|nr:hypothetical protein EYC80_001090 [Monilinia laxa]
MADRIIRFKSKREEASRYGRPTRTSQRLNPPHHTPSVFSIPPRGYRSRFAHLAVSAPSAQTTSYCRTKDSRPVSNQATSSPSETECFFQCLSQKLRASIWNLARARTIEIVVHNGLVCCRSPSPITFRINKESRYEFFGLSTLHANFYISGTEYTEKAPYPFFDAAVDSVVVKGSLPGYDPATSRVPLGFYGVPLVVHNYSYLDIFQSLHVAAQPRNWSAISQSPHAYICFANLAEIVFQGG